jgi:general secretion pathway protein G
LPFKLECRNGHAARVPGRHGGRVAEGSTISGRPSPDAAVNRNRLHHNAMTAIAYPQNPRRARRKDERGFTLLELLVVLAILGLLIGLVAPAALRQLGSAKTKIAHQSIERLGGVLDMYKLDVGSYPTTDQGLQSLITRPAGVSSWSGPYLKGEKLPSDPWGRPFLYRSPSQRPGHEYDLYTLGPTGQPGGSGESAPIYNE